MFCDIAIKYTNCIFLIVISILILVIFGGNYSFNLLNTPAYAHITKQVGNMKIEVGWADEPPLTGQVNNIIVGVNKTSAGGHESAVINALSDLDIKEKYGSITKSIDFIPSEQAEGLYESKIIPTRVGSYSLVMNGTIQGETVSNVEIPLDIVQSTQKISFPDASTPGVVNSGTQSASNNIGPKLQTIISGMSNDVQSSKADIQSLAKNMGGIQKSIADIKSSVDRSYMIAMTAIGVGIAGIVIAAASLSHKKVLGLH
jgi:hypothetical protein